MRGRRVNYSGKNRKENRIDESIGRDTIVTTRRLLTPATCGPAHECTGLSVIEERLHRLPDAHAGRFLVRVHRLRDQRSRRILRDHFDSFSFYYFLLSSASYFFCFVFFLVILFLKFHRRSEPIGNLRRFSHAFTCSLIVCVFFFWLLVIFIILSLFCVFSKRHRREGETNRTIGVMIERRESDARQRRTE